MYEWPLLPIFLDVLKLSCVIHHLIQFTKWDNPVYRPCVLGTWYLTHDKTSKSYTKNLALRALTH